MYAFLTIFLNFNNSLSGSSGYIVILFLLNASHIRIITQYSGQIPRSTDKCNNFICNATPSFCGMSRLWYSIDVSWLPPLCCVAKKNLGLFCNHLTWHHALLPGLLMPAFRHRHSCSHMRPHSPAENDTFSPLLIQNLGGGPLSFVMYMAEISQWTYCKNAFVVLGTFSSLCISFEEVRDCAFVSTCNTSLRESRWWFKTASDTKPLI